MNDVETFYDAYTDEDGTYWGPSEDEERESATRACRCAICREQITWYEAPRYEPAPMFDRVLTWLTVTVLAAIGGGFVVLAVAS